MEATSLIGRERKKSRVDKEKETDLGGKNISNLPNDLLQHILSFLPIEDAVRTSILSKTWQHQWKSISDLIFIGLWPPTDIVERVLTQHDSSDIEKFHLSYLIMDKESPISTWISAAVSRNVKDLLVHFDSVPYTGHSEGSFVLPECLCASKTLMKLDIRLPCFLKLPSSVSLSGLKILTLRNVIFADDLSAQKLFNLPSLEQLEILGCPWKNLKAVSICAPRLQRLHVRDMYGGDWWRGPGRLHNVKISGACLTYFQYHGVHRNDCCLLKTSSLAEVEFYIEDFGDRSRQIGYRVFRLLQGLCNVESLKLSAAVLNVLDCEMLLLIALDRLGVTFINLTTLWFCFDIVSLNSRAFWIILQKSPHLRVLHLNKVYCPELYPDWGKVDEPLLGMPTCFLSSLRRIEVHNFYGGIEELNAIRYLLKTAIVLDEMVVTFLPQVGSERATMILQQLLKIPRWLEIGKIDFV